MNGRKILDFILKYGIVLILLFPIAWFGYIILYWGGFGMSSEVPGSNLTETYLKIGDYSIGKQKWLNNICHKKDGCLNGEILGFKEKGSDAYIHIQLNYSKGGFIDGNTGDMIVKSYDYYFYNRREYVTINNLDDLPTFGYLNGNQLKFYSKNDLKNLPVETQVIFKELEKNPTIIINGLNNTK